MALVVVLIVMLFLGALGSALLALTVLDLRIGGNHETSARLLYLAQAGIDDARTRLQKSTVPLSQLLAGAAGADGVLAASRDPEVLQASDDVPFINTTMLDPSLVASGEYTVFLTNDAGDGVAAPLDSNRMITLVGIGGFGDSRKVLTSLVTRSGFPELKTAITAGVFLGLDRRLQSAQGTERLVEGIVANATSLHNPPWDGAALLTGAIGAPNDYPVTVVNGDARLGPADGYGVLLVRGNLTLESVFTWHGLILVIGQGTLQWPASTSGSVAGAIFISRTRASDRDAGNPLGTLLPSLGAVVADFSGNGVVSFDPTEIERAGHTFPYVVVATREQL